MGGDFGCVKLGVLELGGGLVEKGMNYMLVKSRASALCQRNEGEV